MEDPIVDEVRQVRAQHAAKNNSDLVAIFRDIKLQERQSGRRHVTFPARHIETEEATQVAAGQTS